MPLRELAEELCRGHDCPHTSYLRPRECPLCIEAFGRRVAERERLGAYDTVSRCVLGKPLEALPENPYPLDRLLNALRRWGLTDLPTDSVDGGKEG